MKKFIHQLFAILMVLVMLFDAVPVTALAEDEDIQPEAVVTALAEGEEKKPEDEVTASAEGEEKKPEAEAAASAEGENTQPKAEGDTSVESGNAAVETNPVSRGGQLNVEKANYHLLKANEYTVISVTGSFDRFLDPNYILGSASQAEKTRGLSEEGDSAASAGDTQEVQKTQALASSAMVAPMMNTRSIDVVQTKAVLGSDQLVSTKGVETESVNSRSLTPVSDGESAAEPKAAAVAEPKAAAAAAAEPKAAAAAAEPKAATAAAEPKASEPEAPAAPTIQEATGLVAYEIELNDGVPFAKEYDYKVQILDVDKNILEGVEEKSGQTIKIDKVDYRLFHIHGETEKEISKSNFSVNRTDGTITDFSFTTTDFSTFVLVYTVEYHYTDNEAAITLDFTGFEPYSEENASRVFKYDTEECVVRATVEDVLKVAQTEGVAADSNAQNFEINFKAIKVKSAEGGVALAKDGSLVISADGTIVLTEGVKTLTVTVAFTKLKETLLEAAGVTIDVEQGKVPLGSKAQYTPNGQARTAELAEMVKNNLGEEEEEAAGYRSADLRIVLNDKEVPATGRFTVALEKSSLIPAGMKLEKLYHIHDGKVEELAVTENADGRLVFELTNFSDIVAGYTVDFVYIEKKTEISIDLDKLQKNGNELSQLIQKNSQELEEIAIADIWSFISKDAANQDLHTEVYTVSLSNGAALDDFDAEFFSVAGVEVKGAGVEYGAGKIAFTDSFETAKITFSTEKAALVLNLINYAKPEKTLTYTFHGVDETASIAGVLSKNGIVSSYNNAVVSDETAVTVDGDTLTALSFFDEVTLTVTLEDESIVVVTLTNSEFIPANQTVQNEAGTFTAAVDLPVGAELKVADAEVNESVVEQAKAALGEEAQVLFYDISIVDADKNEIETGATVTLNLGIDLSIPEGKMAKVTGYVYHIAGKDVEKLDAAFTVDEKGIKSVTFLTDGFSVFGIAYTVDFTNAGTSYSIPGNSQILLSKLIDNLNIVNKAGEKINVADVASVEFTDEHLVTIQEVSGHIAYNDVADVDVGEKDFLLSSEQEFTSDETLTINLTDGEVITVGVTDAIYVTDISDLLKTITVNGTDYSSGGNGTVAPGDNLSIKLDFREQDLTKFDRTGPLTYQLPDGLKMPVADSGELVPSDDSLAAIYSIQYTITPDDMITFYWNVKEGKDEEFKALSGIFIQMDIDVTVDASKDETIHVGEGTLTVVDEHDLGVSKSGYYDSTTNQMIYTVVVSSTGDNTNVKPITITDTISGTALSLVNNSATIDYGITNDKINFTYDTENGKVVATIPDGMSGGQSISFKYRADVNLDVLATEGGSQGKYGTPNTTRNSVTVSGFDNPDDNPNNDTATHSVDHEIQFSSATKTGESGEFENGKRTVNWEITANTEYNKGISYITDAMGNGKDKMNYSGDGITVYVYHKENGLIATLPVSWNTLNVQKEAEINPDTEQVTKAKSEGWRYDIPTEYQTADYSFVVDYSTAVDVSGAINTTDVSNTVQTDYAQGGASAKAEPAPGYKLTFDKSVAENGLDIPNRTVNWDISFDVPTSGLSSAEITDTLPYTINTSLGDFYDGYDSYTYEGLMQGESIEESFETTTVDSETVKTKVIFTFYKLNDEGEKVTGLYPSNESRKVTVHLKTTLNEDWLNSTPDSSTAYAYLNHTNLAVLVADNITLQDSDTVQVDNTEPTTAKSGSLFGNLAYSESSLRHEANAYLPAYQYEVFLYNIDDSCFNDSNNLVIDDTFEGKYLKYYQLSDEATGTEGHIVSNNDNIVKMSGNEPQSYGAYHQKLIYIDESNAGHTLEIPDANVTVQNGRVVFTLPRTLFPLNSEEFYKQYSVKYILYVNGPTALDALKQDTIAAGGIKQLNNTAFVADKMEGTSTVKYEVPISTKSYETLNAGEGKYRFTIDVNPNAKTFGNGFLTVTDTYDNLTVDYDSIQCEPKDALLNLNHSGNTVTYVVKNSTHVVITYDALAVKSGSFSNDVVINGTNSHAEGTAKITSRGSTGTDRLSLTVQKHASGNMLELLEGVKFKLYLYDENAENHYGTQVNGPGEDNCWVTDAEGKINFILPVLRDNNGAVTDTTAKYVLHEVGNLPGYKPLPHDYVFTIDRKNLNYGQYIYLDKDTMPIANEPEEEEELTVTVEKVFDPDVTEKPQVTIHLYEKAGRLVEKSSSDTLVGTVTLPFNDPLTNQPTYTYVFEHLPSGKAYYVVEDPIPGYVVNYSGSNGLGLDHTGTIKVTNIPFEISVEKKWLDSSDTAITDPATLAQLPDVTVHLYKNGQLVSGQDKVLKAATNYADSWTGLMPGVYTVVEEAAGEQVSIVYTDTDSNTGSALDNVGGSIVITNKVQPVTVKKIWNDNNNAEGKRPASVSVTLLKDGNPVSTKELTIATSWEAAWYDLSADGNYTFSEATVSGYEQESIVYKDAAGYSYYHKTNNNNEVAYDPATGNFIWSGPSVPYTTAQLNGTVEITNKPVEIKPDKIQVEVRKVWNDGTSDLTAEQAAAAGLSAKVKLVEYRTEKTGVTLHFYYPTADWSSFTSAGTLDIIKNINVSLKLITSNINYAVQLRAITSKPNSLNDFNNNPVRITGQWSGEYLSGQATYIINTPSDLYIIIDNNSFTNPSVSEEFVPTISGIPAGPFDVTGKTLTLAGPDYTDTFYNLNTSKTIDGKNYNLSYAVMETLPDSGYTVEYKVGNGEFKGALTAEDAVGGAGSKTITVKNTKSSSSLGALKFTKQVTLNGEPTTAINGDYTFNITGADTAITVVIKVVNGVAKSYKIGEAAEFTAFEEGNSFVVIKNLAEGDYVITETVPSGMTTKVSGGKENKTAEEASSITVHVEPDGDVPAATATATFINNTDQTSVTVRKVWNDDNNRDGKRPTSIQVQLYADEVASGDAVMLNEDGEWTYTWPSLATKNGDADIVYTVKEVGESDEDKITFTLGENNTVEYSVTYSVDDATGDKLITNAYTPETTTVTATKEWQDKSGTKIDWPEGAEITFGLFVDDEPVNGVDGQPLTCVLDNTADEVPAEAVEPYAYESAAGVASFVGLPKYKNVEGTPVEIEYVVKETATFEGYLAQEITDEGVIVNKEKETVSIDATKSWGTEDEDLKASAVQFTLYRKVAGSDVSEAPAGAVQIPETTGDWYEQIDQKTVLPDTWSVSWGNLPKFEEDGTTEIVYKVVETGVYFGEQTEDNPDTTEVDESVITDWIEPTMYTVEGGEVENGEATITNTPITVDVPVEKEWEDFDSDESYDWSVTFRLQWAPKYTEEGTAADDDFKDYYLRVNGAQSTDYDVTITKEQMADKAASQADRTFSNLPKYGVDDQGRTYRIQYSLDEISYEVKQNDSVIYSYDKATGVYYPVADEEHYEPFYPHDAGELNANDTDYFIRATNHKKNTQDEEYINVKVTKTWEDANGDPYTPEDWETTFQIMRYKGVGYRDITNVTDPDADPITVTLGNKTIEVVPGTGVRLVFGLAGYTSGPVSLSYDVGGTSYPVSFDNAYYHAEPQDIITTAFYPTQNTTVDYAAGGGLQVLSVDIIDTLPGVAPAEDTAYTAQNNTFTLDKEHPSATLRLLRSDVSAGADDGQQNVNYYEYFFKELSSNPDGYYVTFTDEGGHSFGTASSRLTTDKSLTATNRPIPPFSVKKEWFDSKDPDNFPEVRFTLYQGVVGNDGKLQQGQVFVDENGKSYVDIPLNSDNGWSWKCPGYLPDKNASGQNVGYYVVESCTSDEQGKVVRLFENSELNVDGSIKVPGREITSSEQKQRSLILKYYNSNGDTANWDGQNHPLSWLGGSTTNSDTLTITNRSPKFIQFDVKKKWLFWDNGELKTETTSDYMQTNIFVKLELLRKTIKLDGTYNSESDTQDVVVDWESYGLPFIIGYDTPGHPLVNDPNNFRMSGDESWYFWISDSGQSQGLPAYGYYEQTDGTFIPVKYYYVTRELGVYSDLNGTTPWSSDYTWYGELLPQAWGADNRPVVFPAVIAQDQDRLVNIQASDLQVQKDWTETPNNVTEVYFKIWLKGKDGNLIDFTNLIAAQTDSFENVNYGFVSDKTRLQMLENGVLVLGITRDSSLVLISNVPVVTNKGLNEFYVEEVGYKDSDGNVYLNSTTPGETSTFFAEYDHWDSATNSWTGGTDTPSANSIQLTAKGNNKLRVKNQPTKDIEVVKEWYDENGQKLTEPWSTSTHITSVSFKVKRSDGQYLTFGGSDTLTIKTSGQRAVVRTATQDSTVYTVSYVIDNVDKAEIGNWTTLIHGLQKYASDGTEYTYTVEELKDQDGKPLDGNNNVIQNCVTTVTGSERSGYVIKNEKVDTSLAIEKTFAGDVELNDEQKQKITFTVKGKFDGTTEETRTFTYGKDGLTVGNEQQETDKYKWKDGVLVIKDIQPGTYTVTEQNDDVISIFGSETPSTYTHTSTCTVTSGTVTGGTASATVTEGERTTVSFVNTYDEMKYGALNITKTVQAAEGSALPEGYANQAFRFTVQLTNPNGLPTTVPVTIVKKTDDTNVIQPETDYSVTDGAITVDLKDNEKALIKKLPIGTTYRITETEVAGYTLSWNETNRASGTISATTSQADATNTFVEYTPLVNKKLNGVAFNGKLGDGTTPANFTFELKEMTVSGEAGSETYTFADNAITKVTDESGLVTFDAIKYNAPGTYYYQITEQGTDTATMDYDGKAVYLKVVVGNDLSVEGTYWLDQACKQTAGSSATFENTELTQVSKTKAWSTGTWPDDTTVTFTLSAAIDGVNSYAILDADGTAVTVTKDATSSESTVTWTNLPKYYLNGTTVKDITYTVTETSVTVGTGASAVTYSTVAEIAEHWMSSDVGDTITNTPTTTTVNGTKTWWINGTQVGNPTVKLYQSVGSATATVVKAAAATPTVYGSALGDVTDVDLQPTWNGNTYTFAGLRKYDDAQQEYTYTVAETEFTVRVGETEYTYTVAADGTVTAPAGAPAFTYSQDGYNLTNTEVTTASVNKTWTGTETSRIESITYRIRRTVAGHPDTSYTPADVTVAYAQAVTSGLGWGYTWSDLSAYGAGTYDDNGTSTAATGALAYTVEEVSFVYGGVTYNVTKNGTAYSVEADQSTMGEGETAHTWQTTASGNTFTNELFGSVKVTKSISGVTALPVEFKITASWTVGSNNYSVDLTTSTAATTVEGTSYAVSAVSGAGTAASPYEWTISNLPIGTEVTFTEDNYTVAGYNVTATLDPTTGRATAAETPGTVAITNDYMAGVELPSTGGPGTLLYTLTGLSLALLAAWLLLRRRREQN